MPGTDIDRPAELPRSSGLVYDTAIYGMGEVLGRMLTLLLLPLFTRYLSPGEYGVVSLLTALTVLIVPVFSLGVGAALAPLYFERQTPERRQETIGTSLAVLGVPVTALAAAGWIAREETSLALFGTSEHGALVFLTAMGAVFTILTVPLRQRLQFERQSLTFVRMSLVTLGATTVLMVIEVAILVRGARGMIEATCVGQAVGLGAFGLAALSPGSLRPRAHLARELLALGIPLLPGFVAVFLLQHGTKYVVQWERGLDEVGRYSVGTMLGMAVAVAVTAFQGAWLPYFMQFADRRDEAPRTFGRILTLFVLSLGGVAMVLFASSRLLTMLLADQSYFEAWQVIGLSATAQVLSGVFLILLPGVYYAKEIGSVGLTQTLAAAGGLGLALVLTGPLGAFGAGVAFAGSYMMLVFLQHGWNRYRGYTPILLERRRLVLFTIVFVGFAALTFWQPAKSHPTMIAWDAALTVSAPAIVYMQLRKSERTQLWKTVREGWQMFCQRVAQVQA